ncbi:Craniofacial development protein 1/Bucentaur [Penicillium expansum]|nr:Craniofacial development protein 1/Bucentaur [Penicillium expansum]
MNEQPAPPTGPSGGRRDRSTAHRRRKETWRSRRRQHAAQAAAAAAHDARVAELMVRAIQQQVDQEGLQPSAARDARVAELTVRAIQAQLEVRNTPCPHFSHNPTFFWDGSTRGGRSRGRGRGRGRHVRGGGGSGRDADREGGRSGYDRMGGHGPVHGAGVGDAGQQNPPGNQLPTHQLPGHQLVREPAPGDGPRLWTRFHTLEEMAGKNDSLLSHPLQSSQRL